MERVRFCRGCGEPFGWDLGACPSCGHAVARAPARTPSAATKGPRLGLTHRRVLTVLLFVAVLAALWLLSSVPTWLID